jgi:hypothetical protein
MEEFVLQWKAGLERAAASGSAPGHGTGPQLKPLGVKLK